MSDLAADDLMVTRLDDATLLHSNARTLQRLSLADGSGKDLDIWGDGRPTGSGPTPEDINDGMIPQEGEFCESRECGGCKDGDEPCNDWKAWWAQVNRNR